MTESQLSALKPMTYRASITSTACICLLIFSGYSDEKFKSKGSFIDFNFYPYTKVNDDNSFTTNPFLKLPKKLSYFSLTNFSNQENSSELGETFGCYTDQNLRCSLDKIPFDLTVQWDLRSGNDNDHLHLGTLWSLHKKFNDYRVGDEDSLGLGLEYIVKY